MGMQSKNVLYMCTYCGLLPGTHRDHVIPVASKASSRHFDCETVPACPECNNILSNTNISDIQARRAYILAAIQHKYKKLLISPEWEDWEIAELSESLRRDVENHQEHKHLIMDRCAWIRAELKP